MKTYVIVFVQLAFLLFENAAFAAKKDFKGLFGSYRRDRFTENEGRPTDWGVDLMLSTLLPLQPLVKSVESTDGTANTLSYSAFFNVEGSVFMSMNYHWQPYLTLGYYTYDSRKENEASKNTPQTPIFHEFSLSAFPVIIGTRYRFSREDIVPYLGLGAGCAFVTRTGSYDNDTSGQYTSTDKSTVLAAHASAGVEFYFHSRAGIRLEISGLMMALPARTYAVPGATASQRPIFEYQANPISVRYASGIFVLF